MVYFDPEAEEFFRFAESERLDVWDGAFAWSMQLPRFLVYVHSGHVICTVQMDFTPEQDLVVTAASSIDMYDSRTGEFVATVINASNSGARTS